ncbi:MAG: hypothetical protein PHP00_01705 [Thiotrichaceae bacterium]|nr:hypothetical protein [Thiotrichaceae bacterium]
MEYVANNKKTKRPALDMNVPLFIKVNRECRNTYRNVYRKLKFFWQQCNLFRSGQFTVVARAEILSQIEEKSGLITLETASPNSLVELQQILRKFPEREEVQQRFPRARVLLLGHAVDMNILQMKAFGSGWCSGNLNLLNPPVKSPRRDTHWFLGNEILSLARSLAAEYGGTVLTGACDRICHGNPHQNRLDTVKEVSTEHNLYRLPDVVLINAGDYERVFDVNVPVGRFFKILSEEKVDKWLEYNGLYKDEQRWLHYIED